MEEDDIDLDDALQKDQDMDREQAKSHLLLPNNQIRIEVEVKWRKNIQLLEEEKIDTSSQISSRRQGRDHTALLTHNGEGSQ